MFNAYIFSDIDFIGGELIGVNFMKDYEEFKKNLKLIKRIGTVLSIIGVLFIIFGKIGIALTVAIVDLLFEWKFYRCPYCKKGLDPRQNFDKDQYCPHCGDKIELYNS